MAKGITAVRAEDDWQTEQDMRTLMEAEKIKADPKRMAKVTAMAKKKMMEVAAIAAEGSEKSS